MWSLICVLRKQKMKINFDEMVEHKYAFFERRHSYSKKIIIIIIIIIIIMDVSVTGISSWYSS